MDKITVSVPRSSGEDAVQYFDKDDKGEYKPLKLRLTNKVHRDIGLPEVGLTLGSCLDDANCSKDITLKHPDELISLMSSISQIAKVNGYDDLVDIEFEAKQAKKPVTRKPKA